MTAPELPYADGPAACFAALARMSEAELRAIAEDCPYNHEDAVLREVFARLEAPSARTAIHKATGGTDD